MLISSSFYILFSVPESLCQHHLPPASFSQKILKKPTQCSLTLQLQIFDHARSGEFWCDKAKHHQCLTVSCFQVMEGLQFNMANIPSSFIFDCNNHALTGEVEQNISPVLSYSCQNWDHHLSATKLTLYDSLHKTLSRFLQLHALFWIEVMNLLDSCGHCHPMLQTAHEWVIKSKASVVWNEKFMLILPGCLGQDTITGKPH